MIARARTAQPLGTYKPRIRNTSGCRGSESLTGSPSQCPPGHPAGSLPRARPPCSNQTPTGILAAKFLPPAFSTPSDTIIHVVPEPELNQKQHYKPFRIFPAMP